MQKYGNVDTHDIRVKLDAIKQEHKERVLKYFERLDKLFQRGRIPDAEQRRRFLGRLRPEIRKLCVVRMFADIEELVGVATELERVLGELGETPYKPLKEEQEEGVEETMMEKQVVATPLWPSVGVKPNTWKSWRLGVLRDSRMFKARQQGAKHLVLGCSWCHWKGLET